MQTYYGKEKQQEVVLFKNQTIIKIQIVFSNTFLQNIFNIKASIGENEVKIMVCSTMRKLHMDTLLPCQDINIF